MSPINRGFTGRPRRDDGGSRIPPGQYETHDFPVLAAGPTPHTPLDRWSFSVEAGEAEARSWSWAELLELPAEAIAVDIHCVTKWSKLGTHWRGVSIDTLLDGVQSDARFAMAFCDGGYTTNLPLADLTGGRAWVAYEFEGAPLDPEH
ncbi:MAG TPA: molybdopterin-dependent oxidoreductase, partial [Solirubrobacteraceae bacterium]